MQWFDKLFLAGLIIFGLGGSMILVAFIGLFHSHGRL